jgi:hypothetical protein
MWCWSEKPSSISPHLTAGNTPRCQLSLSPVQASNLQIISFPNPSLLQIPIRSNSTAFPTGQASNTLVKCQGRSLPKHLPAIASIPRRVPASQQTPGPVFPITSQSRYWSVKLSVILGQNGTLSGLVSVRISFCANDSLEISRRLRRALSLLMSGFDVAPRLKSHAVVTLSSSSFKILILYSLLSIKHSSQLHIFDIASGFEHNTKMPYPNDNLEDGLNFGTDRDSGYDDKGQAQQIDDIGMDGVMASQPARIPEAPECIRNMTLEERAHAELRLRQKIDLRLMPMIILMYILNYLDRNNIAAAKLAGILTDLHLKGVEFQVSLSWDFKRHN